MKKMLILLAVVAAIVMASHQAKPASAGDVKPSVAVDKKVKTSVTGAGDSRSKAEIAADSAARSISSSYTVVNRNTTGSGSNWICTLVIEYTQKN